MSRPQGQPAETLPDLAQACGRWRGYDPARQNHMRAQLERILATPNLSRDVYEIASKSLK